MQKKNKYIYCKFLGDQIANKRENCHRKSYHLPEWLPYFPLLIGNPVWKPDSSAPLVIVKVLNVEKFLALSLTAMFKGVQIGLVNIKTILNYTNCTTGTL